MKASALCQLLDNRTGVKQFHSCKRKQTTVGQCSLHSAESSRENAVFRLFQGDSDSQWCWRSRLIITWTFFTPRWRGAERRGLADLFPYRTCSSSDVNLWRMGQKCTNQKFSFLQHLFHNPMHLMKNSFVCLSFYFFWDRNMSLNVFSCICFLYIAK